MSKRSNAFLFICVAFTVLVPLSLTKTYDRCELARELLPLLKKYRLPVHQISDWICLVRWESEFNTSAIGSLNWDGSLDHGLFQISDNYWCNGPSDRGDACGLTCDKLRDDYIEDDFICAKRVFREHKRLTGNGFNAWVAWKQHCQGDTRAYTHDCHLDDLAINEQQTENDGGRDDEYQDTNSWLVVETFPWFAQVFPTWFF